MQYKLSVHTGTPFRGIIIFHVRMRDLKNVYVWPSHLWVSIWALFSRELLEDCGQTAEHKDGTVGRDQNKQGLRLRPVLTELT